MNAGNTFRFHMGCGEPLRSRWWVALTARNRFTDARGAKSQPVGSNAAASEREDKCKS